MLEIGIEAVLWHPSFLPPKRDALSCYDNAGNEIDCPDWFTREMERRVGKTVIDGIEFICFQGAELRNIGGKPVWWFKFPGTLDAHAIE